MIIETKFNIKKYIQLSFVLAYKRPAMIFLTILGLFDFIISTMFFLGFNITLDELPLFFGFNILFDEKPYLQLMMGFCILVVLPSLNYYSCIKNYSTNGLLSEKINYEFTNDKIYVTGETFKTEKDWTKIYKIIEINNCILIYQSKHLFTIIPNEFFGEKISEFRNIVRSKNIKGKLKKS